MGCIESLSLAEQPLQFVQRLTREFPRREAGSADELGAQRLLAEELSPTVAEIRRQEFRSARRLYAVYSLHFALTLVGSLVFLLHPLAAIPLHLAPLVLYPLESSRRWTPLRRLAPQVASSNLIATLRALAKPRIRFVLVAHADAAPTGLLFHPAILRTVCSERIPSFLRRQMPLFLLLTACLAVHDATYWWAGDFRAILYWVGGLGGAGFLTFANLQLAVTSRISPGANDNASGCACLPPLAERLAGSLPADCDAVFVASGAEEAGASGAFALLAAEQDEWSRDNTIVIAVDSVGAGELRCHVEGEIVRLPIAPSLMDAIREAAAADGEIDEVREYHAPAGATDAAPFRRAGYPAVAISRIDPLLGAPRAYHTMRDDSTQIDGATMAHTIEFVERLVLILARQADKP